MASRDEPIKYMFTGKLYNDNGAVMKAVMDVSYQVEDTDPVRCIFVPLNKRRVSEFFFIDEVERKHVTKFKGVIGQRTQIWIPSLRLEARLGGEESFGGFAEIYIESRLHSFKNVKKSGATCYLMLPQTELTTLMSDFKLDRLFTTTLEEETTQFTWKTNFGTSKLIRTHSAYGKRGKLSNSLITDTYPAIKVEVPIGSVNSLDELVDLLTDKDIEDVICLLSLLAGKRLNWYSARVMPGLAEKASPIGAFVRRETHFEISEYSTETTHLSHLIIDPTKLPNDTFATMVSTLLESKHRDAIIRAIQALMTTFEDFYHEAHLFLVYSAFETLVSSFGDDSIKYIVDDGVFRDLYKELKKTIKIALPGDENTQVRADVYSKLMELQRRPLSRKLELLLEREEFDLDGLIEGNRTKFLPEFKRIIERRDLLTHEGSRERDTGAGDMYFMRYYVSFMILKLLGCPQHVFNNHTQDLWFLERALKNS